MQSDYVRLPDKAGAATVRTSTPVQLSGGHSWGISASPGCPRGQSAPCRETKRAKCGIAADMATLQLATRPPSPGSFPSNRYRAGGLLLIVLAVACKNPAQDSASQRTDVRPALSVAAAPAAAGSNESEAAAQARVVTYQQACKGGDMVSCTNLGVLYEQGTGVTKNAARAATLYQQACAGGEKAGCAGLGVLHARGTGVPKDATKAAAFFQRACAGGFAQACNR